MDRVAGVEADRGLVEPFDVVQVGVAAEQVQLALLVALGFPLGLDVLGAAAEAAAAVEDEFTALGGFDADARGPPAVDAQVGGLEPVAVGQQRLAARRAAEDFLDRAVEPAGRAARAARSSNTRRNRSASDRSWKSCRSWREGKTDPLPCVP